MGDEGMLRRWRETTAALLGSVVSQEYCQPYSICLVPDHLRKRKEEAFKPKMVSIGPRYKGRLELLSMEEVKWRYMMTLLNRTNPKKPIEILETCMKVMLEHDAAVRATYVEEIKMDRFELATIMLHDACFLLEFLISTSVHLKSELPSVTSFYDQVEWFGTDLMIDLMMVENQMPLFILYKLFHLLFPQLDTNHIGIHTYISITQHLALSFFFRYSPDSTSTNTTTFVNATHFLELIHSTIVRKNNLQIQQQFGDYDAIMARGLPEWFKLYPEKLTRCANRLRAAGVKFKCKRSQFVPLYGECELVIKFNKSDGVLEIPELCMDSLREARWRNLIAWEQDRMNSRRGDGFSNEGIFTFLAFFFNELICCQSDVQLLKDMKIITDSSNHTVMDLFRSMTSGVRCRFVHPIYCHIIKDLNDYSETNCLIKYPIIVWHYLTRISEWCHAFNKFLRRGYNFAAALLGLLTLIQTFYAFLSYHYPQK